VEDEPLIADNIAAYLNNEDFETCGIAYNFREAKEQLNSLTPDAAILDINLHDEEDGIHLAEYLNKYYPIPFIYLTSYSDRETLNRAKKVHPSGYIVKPFTRESVLAALEIGIHNFHANQYRIHPEVNFIKLNNRLLSPMSLREFDILILLLEGVTNTQIAERLFISINTVKSHLKNIYLKLDAGTRMEVIKRLQQLLNL
jgi:DNA-binding NarL/FixJ family response regulator